MNNAKKTMDPQRVNQLTTVRKANNESIHSAYGDSMPLSDAPYAVREEVFSAIAETNDNRGTVNVGGQFWAWSY